MKIPSNYEDIEIMNQMEYLNARKSNMSGVAVGGSLDLSATWVAGGKKRLGGKYIRKIRKNSEKMSKYSCVTAKARSVWSRVRGGSGWLLGCATQVACGQKRK